MNEPVMLRHSIPTGHGDDTIFDLLIELEGWLFHQEDTMSDMAVASEKAKLYDAAAAEGKVPTYEKVQEDAAKADAERMKAEAAAEAKAAAAPPKSGTSGSASSSTTSASR